MRKLALLILKLSRWKVSGGYDETLKNCVIVLAPHTSQWDFVWAMLTRTVLNVRAKYLIKDSFFKPGISWFFRFTGGIPVDRSKQNDLTQRLKQMLNRGEELKIVFTPEGTRKAVDRWKKGFYWVAVDTGLPIVMHAIDYGKKEVRQSQPFYPTGNWEQDKTHFEAFYAGVTPKNPEGFNKKF